jgi:selenocysteine lyase/cysteine desulfurase
MTQPAPPFDLAGIRAGIPILDRMVVMNGCSQAPKSAAATAAVNRYLESWERHGMAWDLWLAEVEAARRTFARLINAEPSEVAVFSSVSHATAAVASALDLLAMRAGRNRIAVTGAEFPTVAHVWAAVGERGFEIDRIPVDDGAMDPARIQASLTEETLLLSAAHGYYQTGALLDLGAAVEAARGVGALLFVDAYQSLGPRTPDVKALGIDMLASGCLKFLMGTPGIAFLYVREEVAERLEPAVTGWFGRADPMAFDPTLLDWAPGARRFDTGTPPILPAYVARAGIETVLEVGPERVEAWTLALSRRLAQGAEDRGLRIMSPADPAMRTPTTAIDVTAYAGGSSGSLEVALRERGVLASARGPALRLAPNFFNSAEDVDRAVDVLEEVLRTPSSEGRAGS